MISIRRTIERITPYVPGRGIGEVAREFGLERVVKLASNENPLGPSPQAVEAMRSLLESVALYPDGASTELVQRLSEHLNVPPESIIVGNGSDEVIKLLAEAYLEPEDEVIYADPTFSEYAYAARLMGAKEVVVPLTGGYVHDLDAMLEAVTERTKLVFVCNPNNPTGTAVSQRELERFLNALPESALLVCDEAYYEYVDTQNFPDTLQWVREGRRVFVLRTFSKVYGLAGLRVGYGLAPEPIMGPVRRVKEPFNVNLLGQAAAVAALADREHLERSQVMNRTERQRLTERLTELGFSVTPSQTNFLWVGLGQPAKPVFDGLMRRGMIVRSGDAFGAPNHIRVTVGTPEHNELFLNLLEQVISRKESHLAERSVYEA